MEPITNKALPPLPLVVVTALDAVLRDECCWAVAGALPGAGVLRYDGVSLPSGGGFRRTITRGGCVVQHGEVDVAGECGACALRIDLLMVLDWLRGRGAGPVVLGLPPGADLPSIVAALDGGVRDEPELSPAEVRQVVFAQRLDALAGDLMGDDLLAERGIAWEKADRRSVGEVLAQSAEYADLVVGRGDGDAAHALLAHLAGDRLRWLPDVSALDGDRLVATGRDAAAARRRVDPRWIQPAGVPDSAHAWTVDLASWRPLHPGRLARRLADLGLGPIRGRGRFWLPTRPDVVCRWDGAGQQLSIGDDGDWNGAPPSTRIVITGSGAADRDRVCRVFGAVLMTDRELVSGLDRWRGQDDGLDAWLGTRDYLP